ncbi:indole-3-glycerol phosphate synthase TrpC [Paenibacillus thermoaerophilus]|uniref:Indole-3-glycerol phosphate synthase n=1 Tax=Paenibacillus thermoaerophilus TaxID=1215385 RepID=A0ABW2V2T4_9BACL|nr:indole-3-glycerol phosphate synthase TrpC [Paenibacillus thermoaerophilus]TMV18700.1 indole-3-glycerol phosphate synthase TrpC [Paenibacillus thermoaerophilus]
MFLDKIVETKRREVAELKAAVSAAEWERRIAGLPPTRGFVRALEAGRRHRAMGLIAEVKKASPSKGLIRADFEPVGLARQYAEAGADCISVLTDAPYFQGANEYLTAVREAVQVPLLRKDFTIDEAQIYEARAIGADAILLIAAILTTDQMKRFAGLARDLGLDVLVEVHDREELERAIEVDARLLGINNRNLRTFVTDLKTTEELIAAVPPDRLVISESGISKASEIEYLLGLGAQAVLVGEHFMRRPDVGAAVEELLGAKFSKA